MRVEICGKEWNQNCSFFVVNLLTKQVFWPLSAFHFVYRTLLVAPRRVQKASLFAGALVRSTISSLSAAGRLSPITGLSRSMCHDPEALATKATNRVLRGWLAMQALRRRRVWTDNPAGCPASIGHSPFPAGGRGWPPKISAGRALDGRNAWGLPGNGDSLAEQSLLVAEGCVHSRFSNAHGLGQLR